MDSGRQVWAFETKGQVASSPAVWHDAVYFGSTDGVVYSVGLKRGELRWQFKTDGPVISSPTIYKDMMYLGSTDHNLYAFSV